MAISVVGISHRTAPLEVRERFVVPAEESSAVLRDLVAAGCDEAVLLSTCNRTELYVYAASSQVRGPEVGLRTLCHRSGMGAAAQQYLYTVHEESAARHLFRVVGSLDSMVLGEAQIQGQVREAYRRAVEIGSDTVTVGPVLARLFETALAAGGRIRSDTSLGVGAASVPSAAVDLARKIFGPLRGRSALVLGAGKMSGLVLACLRAEGVASVAVTNRTESHARRLVDGTDVDVVPFDRLPELLARADVVVSATSAPHAVVTREVVAHALAARRGGPLMIVDIALPRDVEPEVGDLKDVFLYDLDDLHHVVDGTLERRRSEISTAEQIIDDAVADFRDWYRGREVVPVIRELRERAEHVRRQEVERALRRLGGLSHEEREAVEALTRRLMAKVLHEPTLRIREAAGREQVVETARFLFGIEAGEPRNGTNHGTEGSTDA